MLNLSIVTAEKPSQLSKGFKLNPDGELIKTPGGQLATGTIAQIEIRGIVDLAEILRSLTPKQALIYGIPKNGASRVVTRKMFELSGQPVGVTPRTNEAFVWPPGGGVMMLDYDPRGDASPALTRDELLNVIRSVAPGLSEAEMLWFPSASSCIYRGETEVRGTLGQRIYIGVKDASDIPRAGKSLLDRLWLAGHGYIQISSSGSLLERSLLDGSVWQSSRLDFAGGAACGEGLAQRRGDPVLIPGEDGLIDTRQSLPDLTVEQMARVAAIKSDAKRALSLEADIVQDEWVQKRVAEIVASKDQNAPDIVQNAQAVARRAIGRGVLSDEFLLHVEVEGKIECASVSEILETPSHWHGLLTLDPIEPDYDGRRLVGRLFLMQARPYLYSFAHGGRGYLLSRPPSRIEIIKGHTADAVNATIEVLRKDPITYDFGGELALASEGRVHTLCKDALAHHLGAIIQFWRSNKDGDPIDIDPPDALLKQIIAQGDRRKLKPLAGVITGPTIRLDGSLLMAPGYDPETQLLFDPVGEAIPEIPSHPTLEQAQDALTTLMRPFETFPFVDANARGALLAGLLTAAVRAVIPTAPAFAPDAPIQGSGKSLLASCVGALAEGRSPDVWPHTQGRDDEETRKRLFTALRSGGKCLIWDNIVGVFDSASMAGFITAEAMVDRVLGKSEAVRIPNRVMLILTGNNLSLAGDLPRRVLLCRIDPRTDQPFARQFDLDPLEFVLAHRMEMLGAACTLIRARFAHVIKAAPGRLASFEEWDDLVRQTVVWVETVLKPFEFGDPMDLVREAQAEDPEADALFALLDALRDEFRGSEFTAKSVQSAVNFSMDGPLASALKDIAGDRSVTSAKTLGRVLKFREGRIVHALRLTGRQDKNSGSRRYRVSIVENTGLTGLTGLSPVTREESDDYSFS